MISDDRLDAFHAGQVWEAPRGLLYRVEGVVVGKDAVLRAGSDGRGRKTVRPWDSVTGWVLRSDGELLHGGGSDGFLGEVVSHG